MTTLPEAPKAEWHTMSRLDQVLYLANLGYKILPVHGVVDGKCTCGLAHEGTNSKAGKHPTVNNWNDQATTDPEQLRFWFQDRDELNYGIYMSGSDRLAIDIDVKAGGWDSWWRLYFACEGDFPQTVQVRTGNYKYMGESQRGAHMYFNAPENTKFPANLTKAGYKSIDLRHNAYILGPGSMHASGVRYEWEPGHAPWEIKVGEIPEIANGYLMPTRGSRKRSDSDSSLGDEDWKERWIQVAQAGVVATRYAEVALKNACKELAEMKPGSGRNNALNAKAYTMGRLIGGGQLGLVEAKSALHNAMERSYGSSYAAKHTSVENTLRVWGGGFEVGAMEPKYPNELSEANLDWIRANFVNDPSTVEDVVAVIQQGFFKGSELQRLALQNAVLSLGPIGVGPGKTLWSYSEGFWKSDGRDVVVNRTGRLLGDKARRAHTDAVLHFLETEPPVISGLGPEAFINLKNGMLNWRSGQILEHRPDYFSTIQLPVAWNVEATCPTVDEFLDQVLHEDLIDLVWEIIGVSIYTGIGFQQAIFFDGGGRNGKGTLIRLIEKLIPPSFVSHVELQSFSTDKFAKAQLFNKILNVVGDLSSKALNDTSLFKQLTGQDSISADYKYGATFDYKSEATLLFAANELPYSTDSSHGFFERMLIVPFDKLTLKKHQIDYELEPRMEMELEGVLVKAVEGLRRSKARGQFMPVERCAQALDRYRRGGEWIGFFASDSVEFTSSSKDRVNRSDVYSLYRTWALENGQPAVAKNEFYPAFDIFCDGLAEPKKIDGYDIYTNLRLT